MNPAEPVGCWRVMSPTSYQAAPPRAIDTTRLAALLQILRCPLSVQFGGRTSFDWICVNPMLGDEFAGILARRSKSVRSPAPLLRELPLQCDGLDPLLSWQVISQTERGDQAVQPSSSQLGYRGLSMCSSRHFPPMRSNERIFNRKLEARNWQGSC